jgi:hypothetical protein
MYTKVKVLKYPYGKVIIVFSVAGLQTVATYGDSSSLHSDQTAIDLNHAGSCATTSEEQARADGEGRCAIQTVNTEAQVRFSSITPILLVI